MINIKSHYITNRSIIRLFIRCSVRKIYNFSFKNHTKPKQRFLRAAYNPCTVGYMRAKASQC